MIAKKIINYAIRRRNELSTKTDIPELVTKKNLGPNIPKIIHQTYFIGPDEKKFPTKLKDNIDRIKKLNPDWEYRFYTNKDIEEYINNHYRQLLPFYEKINPAYGAARADFFRYLIIYNEGGVYLDIKANTSKPLSELIFNDDKYLLSHWPRHYPEIMLGKHPGITNPIGELQQWHIAAASGHPFLQTVINRVCNNIKCYNPIFHDYGSWGVFNLTGPIAYTEAIYPLLDQFPHRKEEDHIKLGFIYYALGPENETSGHHKVFTKKHYSKLEKPIIFQPLHINLLFYIIKPVINLLKNLK